MTCAERGRSPVKRASLVGPLLPTITESWGEAGLDGSARGRAPTGSVSGVAPAPLSGSVAVPPQSFTGNNDRGRADSHSSVTVTGSGAPAAPPLAYEQQARDSALASRLRMLDDAILSLSHAEKRTR